MVSKEQIIKYHLYGKLKHAAVYEYLEKKLKTSNFIQ